MAYASVSGIILFYIDFNIPCLQQNKYFDMIFIVLTLEYRVFDHFYRAKTEPAFWKLCITEFYKKLKSLYSSDTNFN